jgi:hypothetical protein
LGGFSTLALSLALTAAGSSTGAIGLSFHMLENCKFHWIFEQGQVHLLTGGRHQSRRVAAPVGCSSKKPLKQL